mmetsp:Transcript_30363/g.49494  ORF Transcript_30363/g.49494 Transcript_30363/m.49494 type:complete len:247 (-) Transcript_30363:211-951(-)
MSRIGMNINGGLLFLFSDMGYVHCNTQYAGASGGALVATAMCCGFSSNEIMKTVLELAEWYRAQHIGLGILETEMRRRFLALLPEEAWSIVGNKLHIAILPLDPRKMFRAELVSNFESNEEMVEALLASSYIPLYLGPSLATKFRNEIVVDGGLVNAVPIFKNSTTICPFPGTGENARKFHPARLIASDVHITPDLLSSNGGVDYHHVPNFAKTLRDSFIPPSTKELWNYYEMGYASAGAWHRQRI